METAETLKEKIDLLGLPEDERKKLEEKFSSSLSYVSIAEIKAVSDVLHKKGEKITKASEVKVLTNPASKIEKNYDFIEEAHEPGIYVGNIHGHNSHVIDILKRINFCKQYNIPYKNEDGTYKDFLFKEKLFQKIVNAQTHTIDTSAEIDIPLENDNDSLEVNVPEINTIDSYNESEDTEHQDIKEYMADAEKELDNIEEATTTFEDIAKRLDEQKAELSAKLNAQLASIDAQEYEDSVYHFGEDLGTPMPETYDLYENEVSSGRGR